MPTPRPSRNQPQRRSAVQTRAQSATQNHTAHSQPTTSQIAARPGAASPLKRRMRFVQQRRISAAIAGVALLTIIVCLITLLFRKLTGPDVTEIKQEISQLVQQNFDCVYYFQLTTLPVDSSYDPEAWPEGVAPCAGDIFSDYQELEDFVRSTYVSSCADRLLSSTVAAKGMENTTVTVPRYQEIDGQLCTAFIDPVTTYTVDFSSFTGIELSSVTKKSAQVTIPLRRTDGTEISLTGEAEKSGEQWLLTDMIS